MCQLKILTSMMAGLRGSEQYEDQFEGSFCRTGNGTLAFYLEIYDICQIQSSESTGPPSLYQTFVTREKIE